MKNIILRKVIPGSTSRLTIVDHNESYGRHILEKIVKDKKLNNCVDLGCGNGADLSIVSKLHPKCELFGIDFGEWNFKKLKSIISSWKIYISRYIDFFASKMVSNIALHDFVELEKNLYCITNIIHRI